jgi:transcriptional regulator with XRE-family HTH domain
VFNLNDFAALAAALGVTAQDISNWRRRNSPPYKHCVKVAKEKGVDLNWLLTGEACISKQSDCNEIGLIESMLARIEKLENMMEKKKIVPLIDKWDGIDRRKKITDHEKLENLADSASSRIIDKLKINA